MAEFNISFNIYGTFCEEWDAAHDEEETESIESKEKWHKDLMEEELSKVEEEKLMDFLEQIGKQQTCNLTVQFLWMRC